ncbi:hypothetical protein PRIPAC_71893 [Pristionchus pacificus]|uniref:BTB domain-containing protein n=1 Tax=Pristionchus pacificus TaxID=54126 RepID=A0A2A6BRJ5_PRIPA|nr:hypothetical protein PRIPAC_71893 [Pristionchus pacificus]|eukprot:PDM68530.1 BTB domain-containing protein [Pristionchus pacificus]
MANFIRKLVDRTQSRSKSPTKGPRQTYHPGQQQQYAFSPWQNEHPGSSQIIRFQAPEGPSPLSYLALPPSPLTPSRNSSRQSNNSGGGNSNDSLGIRTWNTEKDEPFFLNKTGNDDAEPRLFDDPHNRDNAYVTTNSSRGRTRSESPHKKNHLMGDNGHGNGHKLTSRSKSPTKKQNISHNLDYLTSQCHQEGCTASIIVQNARFLVCRHQLTHASEYFRSLLNSQPPGAEVTVSVSGMACPSPVTQFRWFIESTIPYPALKDIGDDTLETCMRLSRRFESKSLELRCNKYVIENASQRQPMVVLCWLNWCLQHSFAPNVKQACLPSVARLSLATLEQHRHMLTEKIFGDIAAAKLRSCYDKCVNVFSTIHRLDHFTVELDRCPRCGRTKEQGRVRVHAFPCRMPHRKLIGCERCTKELDCELAAKSETGMNAFYQCSHALLPLNDSTEDCFCQITNLASHFHSSFTPLRPPPHIDSNNQVPASTRPPEQPPLSIPLPPGNGDLPPSMPPLQPPNGHTN